MPDFCNEIIKNSNPPNMMYLLPIPDISNPHTRVLIVVHKLAAVKNNPLANSGAPDIIQY